MTDTRPRCAALVDRHPGGGTNYEPCGRLAKPPEAVCRPHGSYVGPLAGHTVPTCHVHRRAIEEGRQRHG